MGFERVIKLDAFCLWKNSHKYPMVLVYVKWNEHLSVLKEVLLLRK